MFQLLVGDCRNSPLRSFDAKFAVSVQLATYFLVAALRNIALL